MESLYQRQERLLRNLSSDFKRYLYHEISWNHRLIGILGSRGVGKTTMLLQHIKESLQPGEALYITADDLYFSENRLFDVAESFYQHKGRVLLIDEIHKYGEWSRELKNIFDSFPELQIIFTGSSVLDILKGYADLSRRALVYTLQGLSFREYLMLFHGYSVERVSLKDITEHRFTLPGIEHPLPYFKDYLKRGYYPFSLEGELTIRLRQILVQTLETDIPQYAHLSVGTSRKLKRLLGIIAASVPFKPNFSKIARLLDISRNSLDDYFSYLETAGLLMQLRSGTKGIRELGKVNKVYLENSNIIYALAEDFVNIGNVRETFFFNQMKVQHEVTASKNADFDIEGLIFEIGGKNKKPKNLGADQQIYIVKDDIEVGFQNILPLWAFGLTY
ncbi:MAG: AAA family ATPase [Balneolaceae bacterium]|nr:AAA family ATPase [Balneolaceae bacterium]